MPGAPSCMIGNNRAGPTGFNAARRPTTSRASGRAGGGEELEVGAYTPEDVQRPWPGSRLSGLLAGLTASSPVRGAGGNASRTSPPRERVQPGRAGAGTGHVARALVGTESTCAFTTEATLHLVTVLPESSSPSGTRTYSSPPRPSRRSSTILAGAGGLRPDPRRPDGGPRPQSQWRRPAPRRKGGCWRSWAGQHGRGELQSVRSHRRPAHGVSSRLVDDDGRRSGYGRYASRAWALRPSASTAP